MKFERIGNIAQFINGAPFKPTDWGDSGMRIIRIQNLTDSTKPYNRTNKKIDTKYLVTKGDVLVSWSATIDVFIWEEEDALLNQHIFKVVFDKTKVDKSYFIIALKETINKLIRFAHGSTMKHVVKGDFDNHKIPLPFLPEQLYIANILNKTETLIAKRKESIRLLDEYFKSTFLEMFGDPEKNNNKYPFIELEKLCSEIVDCPHSTPNKSKGITNYPCIRTSELEEGYIDWVSMQYLEEEEYLVRVARLVPQAGDIVYGREGTYGDAIIIPKTHKFSLGQRTMLFRPDLKKTNSIYLWAMVRSDFVYRQAKKKNSGSTVGHVNVKDIKQFRLLSPPIELQNSFALIVEKTESLKTQYQQSLHELENLYGSLSQRAFKGELSFKDEILMLAAEPNASYLISHSSVNSK